MMPIRFEIGAAVVGVGQASFARRAEKSAMGLGVDAFKPRSMMPGPNVLERCGHGAPGSPLHFYFQEEARRNESVQG